MLTGTKQKRYKRVITKLLTRRVPPPALPIDSETDVNPDRSIDWITRKIDAFVDVFHVIMRPDDCRVGVDCSPRTERTVQVHCTGPRAGFVLANNRFKLVLCSFQSNARVCLIIRKNAPNIHTDFLGHFFLLLHDFQRIWRMINRQLKTPVFRDCEMKREIATFLIPSTFAQWSQLFQLQATPASLNLKAL